MTDHTIPRAISGDQREHYRLWRSPDWVDAAREAARISTVAGMRPVVRIDSRFTQSTWRLDCDRVPDCGRVTILGRSEHRQMDLSLINDSGLGINVVDWPYDRVIACDGSTRRSDTAWAWVCSTGVGMGAGIAGQATGRTGQPSHLAEAMALCQALLYAATFPVARTVIITDNASLLGTKAPLVEHLHKLARQYPQLRKPLEQLTPALNSNPYDIDLAHVRSHRVPHHPAQQWNHLADCVSSISSTSGVCDDARNGGLTRALQLVGLEQLVMLYPQINVTFSAASGAPTTSVPQAQAQA